MTPAELKSLLREAPLIASVQASPGSPLEDPQVLLRSAQASLDNGSRVLRLQGIENIRVIKAQTEAPIIGLLKIDYSDSPIYITPTSVEVQALLSLGCEVIALDGTDRVRPGGENLKDLVALIHSGGALAMADCDCLASALYALSCGCDLIGTTLAGYTEARLATSGPDLEFLREVSKLPGDFLLVAEGRYAAPWQARNAMAIGADAVVIGGALNDPVKQTSAFAKAVGNSARDVGAVDIGGTWLRFAVFSPELELLSLEKIALPSGRQDRLDWILAQICASSVDQVGISTGGIVDTRTQTVTEAKAIIPNHVGTHFAFEGARSIALNDGLATAWGHAMHPDFAGKRVATLALGTGVGCGCVDRGEVIMTPGGNYPRLNDLKIAEQTFEDLLGGAALSPDPSQNQIIMAQKAADQAYALVKNLLLPDVIIRCGGVGLAPWLVMPDAVPSPYGHEAGLYGAACLALYPPF